MVVSPTGEEIVTREKDPDNRCTAAVRVLNSLSGDCTGDGSLGEESGPLESCRRAFANALCCCNANKGFTFNSGVLLFRDCDIKVRVP